MRLLLFFLIFTFNFNQPIQNELYQGEGSVDFLSEAPLETIRAHSDALKGLLDMDKRTFAFSIRIKSFQGFNSALQKEHFNEHYLESEQYPKATFTGNLIGEFDCSNDCIKSLVAKGKMNIHNETQMVVIPIQLKKVGEFLFAESNFDIALADYSISIPKILEAKIAPIIKVDVALKFEPNE
jgi:polyisoprenoid-binding protein YceI